MTGSARRQNRDARGAERPIRRKIRAMTSPGTLALATRGLRKSYGSRLALDGLDLSVPAGVVYGFLGPNGAGKTTTMRLLTGLLHPDAGSIELLGLAVQPRRPAAPVRGRRPRRVAVLLSVPVRPRRTCASLPRRARPVPTGRIEELLELVGLRERATDKVSGYSLGMKQRLGIAGGAPQRPAAAPARRAGERARSRRGSWPCARRSGSSPATGKTVFVSSHLLAEVQVLADVVGIIAKGKLVREGTLDSMLRDQGVVRVRVPRAQVAAARAALERLAHGRGAARRRGGRPVARRPPRAEPGRRGQPRARRVGHLRLRARVGHGPGAAVPRAHRRRRRALERGHVRTDRDARVPGERERRHEDLLRRPAQARRPARVLRVRGPARRACSA